MLSTPTFHILRVSRLCINRLIKNQKQPDTIPRNKEEKAVVLI